MVLSKDVIGSLQWWGQGLEKPAELDQHTQEKQVWGICAHLLASNREVGCQNTEKADTWIRLCMAFGRVTQPHCGPLARRELRRKEHPGHTLRPSLLTTSVSTGPTHWEAGGQGGSMTIYGGQPAAQSRTERAGIWTWARIPRTSRTR